MNGDVLVRDVMTREFVGASEGDGILETVGLMLTEDAESAIVLRGSEPVGLLTQRDVLALLVDGGDPSATTVGEVMSDDPRRVEPETPIDTAATRLSGNQTRPLVVCEDDVVGLLTERDLLAAATIEPAPQSAPEVSAQTTAGTYSSQSICEACGSLTRDLVDVNGQLLCTDCRDM